MNWKLGEKIKVSAKLKRRSRWIQDGESPLKYEFKFWDEEKLRHPIEGIVIGVRNLSNGKNEYIREYGNSYEPKVYLKALIVAYKLSRKPILVKI